MKSGTVLCIQERPSTGLAVNKNGTNVRRGQDNCDTGDGLSDYRFFAGFFFVGFGLRDFT